MRKLMFVAALVLTVLFACVAAKADACYPYGIKLGDSRGDAVEKFNAYTKAHRFEFEYRGTEVDGAVEFITFERDEGELFYSTMMIFVDGGLYSLQYQVGAVDEDPIKSIHGGAVIIAKSEQELCGSTVSTIPQGKHLPKILFGSREDGSARYLRFHNDGEAVVLEVTFGHGWFLAEHIAETLNAIGTDI